MTSKTHIQTGELAARVGVSASTIRRWSKEGKGPKYWRIDENGARLYKIEDVEAWEASRQEKSQQPR